MPIVVFHHWENSLMNSCHIKLTLRTLGYLNPIKPCQSKRGTSFKTHLPFGVLVTNTLRGTHLPFGILVTNTYPSGYSPTLQGALWGNGYKNLPFSVPFGVLVTNIYPLGYSLQINTLRGTHLPFMVLFGVLVTNTYPSVCPSGYWLPTPTLWGIRYKYLPFGVLTYPLWCSLGYWLLTLVVTLVVISGHQ